MVQHHQARLQEYVCLEEFLKLKSCIDQTAQIMKPHVDKKTCHVLH